MAGFVEPHTTMGKQQIEFVRWMIVWCACVHCLQTTRFHFAFVQFSQTHAHIHNEQIESKPAIQRDRKRDGESEGEILVYSMHTHINRNQFINK